MQQKFYDVRAKFFRKFASLEAKTLAKATKLSERRIFDLSRSTNAEIVDPDRELALDVLIGMATRRLAGLLGTPYTEQNKCLFSGINDTLRLELVEVDQQVDKDKLRKWSASLRLDYRQWESFHHGKEEQKKRVG